jgi:hypothetical protein
MFEKLKLVWWIVGLVLFADTVRKDGFVMGVLNWINPLSPP